MTEGLRLRPVTEPDLDALDEMFADPASIGEFNWGGFVDPGRWRRRHAENGLLAEDRSVLIVELAGESLGFVTWARIEAGSKAAYSYEVGISLWPDARGRGHGTTAQLTLARYLFAHAPTNRIQAFTEVDNIAEQRALEKAGFVREAVLKSRVFRDGEWRDEVLYRMLRSELPVTEGAAATPAG
jgi:RimJ/RimL family protein N-acetyltransferase